MSADDETRWRMMKHEREIQQLEYENIHLKKELEDCQFKSMPKLLQRLTLDDGIIDRYRSNL